MKSLDAIWREAREREADARLAYGRVRLECNGESVGISAEDVLELQRFGHTVLMQFFCPRCGQRHWSKLFSSTVSMKGSSMKPHLALKILGITLGLAVVIAFFGYRSHHAAPSVDQQGHAALSSSMSARRAA